MDKVAQDFHDFYWYSNTWRWTFWHGVPVLKCPLDLWVYQELLWLVRPRLVVELGTWAGGTATFIADMMDVYDADKKARVVTVDVLDKTAFAPHVAEYPTHAPFPVRIRPKHPRVKYITGNSADPKIVRRIGREATGDGAVLVIADSDHSYEHAFQELVSYHDLVTPGSWFVMEDTDGEGPRRAVEHFLQGHPDFAADPQCEKFYMTFNPGGYLRRRA